MGGSHEHIEHAEHAKHAAHDDFDRQVALTIAIIAAVLATVTLLSHRAHNDTLRLQGDANRLFTDANNEVTWAADEWAHYQFRNMRQHLYGGLSDLASFVAVRPDAGKEPRATADRWKSDSEKYRKEKEENFGKAKAHEQKAREKRDEAARMIAESHQVHANALRFDLGELAVEVGLVLCSVAILTKRRSFWFGGVGATLTGALVAASVLYYPPRAHHGDHGPGPASHQQPAEKSGGH